MLAVDAGLFRCGERPLRAHPCICPRQSWSRAMKALPLAHKLLPVLLLVAWPGAAPAQDGKWDAQAVLKQIDAPRGLEVGSWISALAVTENAVLVAGAHD